MELELIDILLRMGAAVSAGIIIGSNRDRRGKPVGMRTLGLFSPGSAIVCLATIRLEAFNGHPDPTGLVDGQALFDRRVTGGAAEPLLGSVLHAPKRD